MLPQPEEVFRGSDEARGEAAERVGQRGALRDRREGHARQRHADDEPGDDRQHDPTVVYDGGLNPGGHHRHRHARHAGEHAAARGLGIVHPVQRKDEQRRGEDGGELSDEMHHCFLNILSMRSVIRNPLTMFVIDANRAIAPRIRIARG